MRGYERLAGVFSTAILYALVTLPLFALWELVQLPLYTIWQEQGVDASLWAAAHCTAGDGAIAFATMATAMLLAQLAPASRRTRVAVALTLAFGLAVTSVVEIASTQWLGRWAYSDAMPTVFGVGLSPLLQWIVVPAIALGLLGRRLSRTAVDASRSRDHSRQ